ncbi:hypothetical protein HMPREF0083_04805 [Aneurinibacillus aneurinilyticus ATCC 12856]|uniref:Uncharacterized protein n=1 Tax=Aneurinibacillus aneurinilyticus ATCC 12856 TaxID=649747 RepID=U1WWP1_ANEAE|nr:hypothetical protein HMPREF0083_04805 [Aneurinibacillus aneurinilyticus ATCC 12856]
MTRVAHPTSSFFPISYFQPHSPVKISSVIYIACFYPERYSLNLKYRIFIKNLSN